MKTRLSAAVLVAFLVAGCAMPAITGTNPGGTGTGTNGSVKPGDKAPIVDPQTGKVLPNQPVEPLNGIEFKPLTQGAAQYLSNNGGSLIAAGGGNATSGAAAPAMAPVAQAAPMAKAAAPGGMSAGAEIAMDSDANVSRSSSGGGSDPNAAGGAFSGNVWSPYHFGYYFGYGGGMDQMALVSVQEAETKGSAGSFAAIVGDVVGPIVKAWAADGRLTQSGAVLTNDGKVYVEPGADADAISGKMVRPGYSPFDNGSGWRMVYTSTTRSEILSFTVTAEKTTIIRMRWAPLDLAPERVLVDSSAAVKKLVDAVSSRDFKGEEEKSMKDYFMGYPFEQPKTGEWDNPDHKTEVLYSVPANARWNVNLQNVMGKVVWELNWWAQDEEQMIGRGEPTRVAMPMPAVMVDEASAEEGYEGEDGDANGVRECPEPEKVTQSYANWGGQGMVDAETGAVIRFTRPTRTTYSYFNGYDYPCYAPAKPPATTRPEPSASATAAPTPTPAPPDQAP